MKKNLQSLYDPDIDIFIGSEIHDELYKAIAKEMQEEIDKEILIGLGFIEIIYSELI